MRTKKELLDGWCRINNLSYTLGRNPHCKFDDWLPFDLNIGVNVRGVIRSMWVSGGRVTSYMGKDEEDCIEQFMDDLMNNDIYTSYDMLGSFRKFTCIEELEIYIDLNGGFENEQ